MSELGKVGKDATIDSSLENVVAHGDLLQLCHGPNRRRNTVDADNIIVFHQKCLHVTQVAKGSNGGISFNVDKVCRNIQRGQALQKGEFQRQGSSQAVFSEQDSHDAAGVFTAGNALPVALGDPTDPVDRAGPSWCVRGVVILVVILVRLRKGAVVKDAERVSLHALRPGEIYVVSRARNPCKRELLWRALLQCGVPAESVRCVVGEERVAELVLVDLHHVRRQLGREDHGALVVVAPGLASWNRDGSDEENESEKAAKVEHLFPRVPGPRTIDRADRFMEVLVVERQVVQVVGVHVYCVRVADSQWQEKGESR